MPELPDVEVFRGYFNRTSLNKRIVSVVVKDDKVLDGISEKKLVSGLMGCQFVSSARQGKYMFARLDDGRWLMMHFGMTGFLKYFKKMDSAPQHVRILLKFSDEYMLAYNSQRKLGRVRLIDSMDYFVEENDLGVDALDPKLNLSKFKQLIAKKRGKVKTFLMNQSVISGIGNIYSDEILFQSGIHPEHQVDHLSAGKIKGLFDSVRMVLTTAIDRKAQPDDFPEGFIIPHRNADDKCPRCGGRIKNIKVNNRGTYLCPRCQK
jgi:formamidopyrimidine-DNA glycosylase